MLSNSSPFMLRLVIVRDMSLHSPLPSPGPRKHKALPSEHLLAFNCCGFCTNLLVRRVDFGLIVVICIFVFVCFLFSYFLKATLILPFFFSLQAFSPLFHFFFVKLRLVISHIIYYEQKGLQFFSFFTVFLYWGEGDCGEKKCPVLWLYRLS